MNLRLFQLVFILIAIVFSIVWIRNFREARIKMFELIVGLLFAVVFTLLAIFPDAITSHVGRPLGIIDNINAMLFGWMILSLWLNFRLWMLIRYQDQRITQLNSKMAIKELLSLIHI